MREGDFSTSTKELLAKRVGYRCSNPKCRQPTSGPQLGADAKTVNVGQAAHIVAASEKGPRGDAPLDPDQRGDLDNGIWLCTRCHKLVDDDRHHYTVDMLRRWKETAEKLAHDEIARLQSPTPTALVLPLAAGLADFTGRQAQVRRVRDQLEQQSAVTITGMGGIGKTALAVHVAHRLVAEGLFPGPQLTIDLKGVDPDPVDPVDALNSLLNAILEPDPNRPRDLDALSALWRAAIQGQDALLILDNAADAAQVRPLLPGCPTCAVLVTSRHRFNLPGAQRLDLRPMPPAEARELLQELAPHLDVGGADRIAGLCGCLPQALRIAGYYLNLNDDVSPEQYASMLADEHTRLAQLRDPDDPALDVAAAIALSAEQLNRDTRRAWALLSLFPAPFDLPAAAALWDEPEGQTRARLQALRNRSLVTYDRDSHRFHQHDLVRIAAADDLQALSQEESHAARLRLARHYEQVARDANHLYNQGGDAALQALALFDLDWPHIQAGQAWAVAHADHDGQAARLCSDYPNAAARILALRLPLHDRIAWHEPALQIARRLGDRLAEGWHLGDLGLAYRAVGEWDRAIEFHAQELEILEQAGDIHGMADTYNNLGIVYWRKEDWDRAIEFHLQALEIYERVGDSHGMARTMGNLGNVYASQGDSTRAIEVYEQSLAIQERAGDIHGMAAAYGNLGTAYRDLGKLREAQGYYTQQLAIARKLGDRQGQGNALWGLAITHADLGEIPQAREKYQQSLAILEALGAADAATVRSLLADLGD